MLTTEELKRFSPFDTLGDDYLAEALSHVVIETFPAGRIVFKRGRVLADKYYLLDGEVDLVDTSFERASFCADGEQDALVAIGSELRAALNPELASRCSCVVKSERAVIIRIETQALDRLLAWNDSFDDVLQDQLQPCASEMGVEEIHRGNSDWMSCLLQTPLFSRVPVTQVQELFLRLENLTMEANQTVFREGEHGDYFYVVEHGTVLIKNRSDSVNLELTAGQYFGEEALLGQVPRNATVVMRGPGKLKRLCAQDFMDLLKSPVVRYIESRLLDKFEKPYKVLDVKMPIEYRAHHFPNSINMPLTRLRRSLADLSNNNTYVVTDDAGGRADIAAHLLCQAGYDAVILKTG